MFDHKTAPSSEQLMARMRLHDDQALRKHRSAVRKMLDSFARAEGQLERWRCEWPPRARELRFVPNATATGTFWEKHLSSGRQTIVVCNELLFFQNPKSSMVVRFPDINAEDRNDKRGHLAEFMRLHGDAVKDPEAYVPEFLYLSAGEIKAAESIGQWFGSHAVHASAPMRISESLKDEEFLRSAPVLVGTIRTSRFIRRFLSAADCPPFRYRIAPDKLNECEIRQISEHERAELIKRGVSVDATDSDVRLAMHNTMGYSYGIVYRMPLPDSAGVPLTIIASTSYVAHAQIAKALTDEEVLGASFKALGWDPQNTLSATFEWLFALKMEPGGMVYRHGNAILIGGHTIEGY